MKLSARTLISLTLATAASTTTGRAETVAPAAPALAASVTPAPTPTPSVVRPQRFMQLTLGLVPPITIDRALGERVTVGFGLHAIVGVTDATAWASISGAADVVTGTASGVQIGGAVASAGRLHHGVQIGGAVAFTKHDLDGLQIAGAVSFADRIDGAQIGGGSAIATHVHGLQLAGGANVADRVEGLQLAGGLNLGGDVRGVQIGAVNIARKMRGMQLGVVNLSEDGDDSYPIGIINYSKNGGVALDGWVDSSRVSALAFRHGTKHIHNIWAIGWSPDHDNVLVGAGLGITRRVGDSLALDIDAMHWLTDVWDLEYGQIDQLRVNLAFPIAKNLELFAGVAANVYVSDTMDESENFHPVMARTYQPTDSTTVVLWPSAFAGIRLTAR